MTPRLRDTNCTYFLCPDRKCQLFDKPDCHVPCDRECPRQAEKAIVCWQCKKVVVLPFNHNSFCRVDCACGASLFTRMSSRYRRYNLPKPK
jgi:hypothetical protein